MATVTKLNLKAETSDCHRREVDQSEDSAETSDCRTKRVVELGNGSQVIYMFRFLNYDQSWDYLEYLNKNIPWNRPTIRVFGRSCVQPRDSCYVASEGLPQLVYSGYQPHAYSWDEFPPLKDILDAVHKALPGSRFNSLLLNRYKGGDDYVGWHADDEKLYGPTPEIASLSFGCEREFLLKKKPDKTPRGKNTTGEPPKKRPKTDASPDKHSFVLKHGSLLARSLNNQCVSMYSLTVHNWALEISCNVLSNKRKVRKKYCLNWRWSLKREAQLRDVPRHKRRL